MRDNGRDNSDDPRLRYIFNTEILIKGLSGKLYKKEVPLLSIDSFAAVSAVFCLPHKKNKHSFKQGASKQKKTHVSQLFS